MDISKRRVPESARTPRGGVRYLYRSGTRQVKEGKASIPPEWLPKGWKPCGTGGQCSAIERSRQQRSGQWYDVVRCACSNQCKGMCDCRVVERKKKKKQPGTGEHQPDDWLPPKVKENRCGKWAIAEKDAQYRCFCLEKLPGTSPLPPPQGARR